MSPKPDHGETSYEGSGLLKDLTAVVTGADSGIGRAVALAFAREGADVVISYLNEGPDAEETERLVLEAGRRALRVPSDLSEETHCRELIARSIAEFGRLDILVNNAAYQSTHEQPHEITSEEFDRAFKTNVYATFHLSQAALKEMKPGGVIINTTSIQSFDPDGMLLPYAATKSAISSMTRSLAELAIKQGVRVNGVAPGPVWTPLIPSTMPPKAYENFGSSSVFKRPAQPFEMAPIYVFLASRFASYVTGEIYGATGGQMPI
jgi:NAD(P)-dependent dehydrogenase (short-subunit alcohol dehydrogenase family)